MTERPSDEVVQRMVGLSHLLANCTAHRHNKEFEANVIALAQSIVADLGKPSTGDNS